MNLMPLFRGFVTMWLHFGGVIIIIAIHQLQFANSCVLQAFKEHLDFHHLKHAIVIHYRRPLTTIAGRREQLSQQEDQFEKSLLNQFMSHYFLKFYNTNDQSADNNNRDFHQLFYNIWPRVGLFMSYSEKDEGKRNILLWASENGWFNYSSSWFVLLNADNNDKHLANIRKTFGHLNVMLNTDVTVAFRKDKTSTLDLYDIYKICHKCGSPLEVEYKGNWSVQNGLRVVEKFKDHFVTRRNNFKNTTVNVATALVNYSPDLNMSIYEYLDDSKHYLQKDFMQRKTYHLLKMTQALYNFTYRITIKNIWGSNENGNWTGVMGLLLSQDAEYSLCPLRVTTVRVGPIVFSPELHVEHIRFILRHPKRSSIRNIFFEPLADTVWWCVLALIVITTFLLAIHVHAEYQIYWKLKRQQDEYAKPHLDFLVLTTLETVFMQGPSPEQFHSNSTRLLLTSVSVFSILLMQFYGAFIVSSLLSEAPRTITNVDALYHSNLEIGMENVTYNFEIFATANNPVVRNIYKNRICKKGTQHILTLEQGVRRIARGGFAFHVPLNRAYRFLDGVLTESQFCELQEITFNAPFPAGVGISKATAHRKFLSTAILRFRETSLLLYNERKFDVQKIDCTNVENDDVEVDLDHFAPVLVFLALAILLSIWAFFLEYLYTRTETRIRMNITSICETMSKYFVNKQ